jgi:hypothetical protein
MLLFVTTSGHEYTVSSLVRKKFGARTPACKVTTYEQLFRASTTMRATHIFTDLERLCDWELTLAASLYRSLRDAGLRCLNDPAKVKCRYELLRSLHSAGLNPFNVYRAEDQPHPQRFPVFLRRETDHIGPLSGLIQDQAALENRLIELRAGGTPLRGMIVVEFAAEPIAPGAWRKYGTFRVGDAVLVDHAVIEDNWVAKEGTLGLASEQMFRDEQKAIVSNAFATELKSAFEISGVEWGRADHADYQGRQIVYEINTNPTMLQIGKQRSAIRAEALSFARKRLAKELWNLDSGDGDFLPLIRKRVPFFRSMESERDPRGPAGGRP